MTEGKNNNSELVKVISIDEIRAIPEFENFSDDQIRDIIARIKEISLLLNQITNDKNISE